MKKTRILFLGTANATRSQMAEAFLRKLGGDRYEAYSAGLAPTGISPYTRQVMEEIGLDLQGQSAKDVSLYLGQLHFGYLITVCADADANCPTAFPGVGQRLHWALDNPAKTDGGEEAKLAAYRRVRDEIEGRITTWLEQERVQDAVTANQ